MDACEATKVVMSRIRDLDPENASKIVGHILLQGQGEKEVIRLAFAPESLLKTCINQAKAFLGISSSTCSEAPTPLSSTILQRTSPRVLNLSHFNSLSDSFSRKGSRPISYAEVVNGSNVTGNDYAEEILAGAAVSHESQSSDFVLDSIASPSGGHDSLVFPYSQLLHGFSNAENGNGERHEMVGSPVVDSSGFDELLRIKLLQQQQRSAFLSSGGLHRLPYKRNNFLYEDQRGDLSSTGLPTGTISSSRQIYLTFPPDSIFKEEDVASYFSTFGPVQGVRIPYQQKRMFGFVTFVDPETVQTILAKGNPHFIRDARVLVKPYKEKGKFLEKKQLHQQMERGVTSSANDSIDQLDIPFGPRMLNAQEKMLRTQFEGQVDSQNEIEFQGHRMMNMQIFDWPDQNHDFDFPSSFTASVSPSSTRWNDFLMGLNSTASSEAVCCKASQDFDDVQALPGRSEFSSNTEHQHDSYTDSFPQW